MNVLRTRKKHFHKLVLTALAIADKGLAPILLRKNLTLRISIIRDHRNKTT